MTLIGNAIVENETDEPKQAKLMGNLTPPNGVLRAEQLPGNPFV